MFHIFLENSKIFGHLVVKLWDNSNIFEKCGYDVMIAPRKRKYGVGAFFGG